MSMILFLWARMIQTCTARQLTCILYNALMDEGHDARLFRFGPSDDETIPGGHQNLKNVEYWKVGCLGITSSCSKVCQDAFVGCVDAQNPATASDRVTAFETCIEPELFTSLGCAEDCAPTFEMLSASEEPLVAEFDNFGAGSKVADAAPGTSICVATSN